MFHGMGGRKMETLFRLGNIRRNWLKITTMIFWEHRPHFRIT